VGLLLGRHTSRQGALAPAWPALGQKRRPPGVALQSPGATWNSPLAALVALLLAQLLLPKHVGRHCCSSGGIPTRPPLLLPKHIGRHCCPRGLGPPTPKGSAKPQGGWVGETCPSSEAPAARVLWQGQATPLALTTLAAMSHCARSCASQERLLVPVVALLLELVSLPKHIGRHCRNPGLIPTRPPLSLPKHIGHHCCTRETAPPTRPPKGAPNRRAGGWERHAPRAGHLRPRCGGSCPVLWRLVKSLASLQKLEWPCKPMRGALSPASRACLK
jgi:hypothetical protein